MNNRVYSLIELESLSEEELIKLIPEDIEEQYNKLPIEKGEFSPKKHPSRYLYKKRQGYIKLLDGSLLFVNDCNLKLVSIKNE